MSVLSDPRARARRRLLGTVIVLALVAVASFVAGRFFSNPASEAAKVAPPDLSRITAPVERRQIRDVSALTCTASVVDRQLRWSGASAGPLVVTSVSDDLTGAIPAGWVPVYVRDRPVIVLHGRLPAYRTLRSGATGSDVVQLQAALAEAGYPTGDSGRMGPGTFDAVRRLYQPLGVPAPITRQGRGKKAAWVLRQDEFLFAARLDAHDVVIDVDEGQVLDPSGPIATVTVRPPSLGCTGADGVRSGQVVQVRDSRGRMDCRTGGTAKRKTVVRCPRPARGAVRADLVRTSSRGPVLAVPSTALVSRGAEVVVHVVDAGKVADVIVRPGVSGGGYTAVRSGDLAVGDEVVVGEQAPGTP